MITEYICILPVSLKFPYSTTFTDREGQYTNSYYFFNPIYSLHYTQKYELFNHLYFLLLIIIIVNVIFLMIKFTIAIYHYYYSHHWHYFFSFSFTTSESMPASTNKMMSYIHDTAERIKCVSSTARSSRRH